MEEPSPTSGASVPLDETDSDQTPRFLRPIIAVVLGLALIAAVGRWFDGFEADDLQHLHAAWMVGQGKVPYRDYFDHHTPLYHVVFAPYASAIGRDPLLLMITFRMLAAVCACGIFYLFWRLIARSNGPTYAWLGLGLLAASRHSDLLFSLRPDYIAVLLLLIAITLMTESGKRVGFRYLSAGICIGLGFGFTQKVLALAPAFVVWAFVSVLRHPRGNRRDPFINLTAILAGMALPPILMVATLARVGALPGFLAGPIGFASHWIQPKSWVQFTQEPVLLEFALFALGFAWALRSVVSWITFRDTADADALLGLLVLFGTVGLLLTPAPTQQAYMITMSLWLHACGIRFVLFLLEHRAMNGTNPAFRYQLFVGFAVALLLLTYYNMLVAATAWAGLFSLWKRRQDSMERRGFSAVWAIGMLALLPAIASIATSSDRILRNSARPQIEAMRAIDHHVSENGAVLTTWPIYTPFRPHATFHWFSDEGMYTSMPLDVLRREYIAALDDLNTDVAVVDRDAWERYLPVLVNELDLRFQEVVVPREGLAGARAYARRQGHPSGGSSSGEGTIQLSPKR